MKKKIITFILVGTTALVISSCGNKELETVNSTRNTEVEISQESEFSEKEDKEENTIEAIGIKDVEGKTETKELERKETETKEIETKGIEEKETETKEIETKEIEIKNVPFSFADLANLKFYFSSGAGGWATSLRIHADGSFSGEYFDGELGAIGEGYPNGMMYRCDFSGQFTQPVQVNDYTYSMQIREISYEKEVGTEEIKDGILYHYVEVYGLDNAEDILIYLPGAPLAELPEEFRGWIGYYNLSYVTETELPFYALNNEVNQYGFSSFNLANNMKEVVTVTEEMAAELENSIYHDSSLTQTEYNEKAQELYNLWDSTLNTIWDGLKQTQDAEKMRSLTAEQLEWIALKEESIIKEGAEYEGGSIQPMIVNLKAAEMTKDRVYKLMEQFH